MQYLFIFAFCLFFFPIQVEAYLDPGTGAMIIQVVIAAVVGAIGFAKLYWSKIRNFFQKNESRPSDKQQ